MILYVGPPTSEAQRGIHVQSRHRRRLVAVMTLLAAIVAAALVPASNYSSSFSSPVVLACGSSPGPCVSVPGTPHPTGGYNFDF